MHVDWSEDALSRGVWVAGPSLLGRRISFEGIVMLAAAGHKHFV